MIVLRSPEPSDVEFIYRVENDTENWVVSNTRAPYSKQQILDHVLSSHNPYDSGQCRLMIEFEDKAIGTVDLFDFDAFHGNGAVGIYIDGAYRQKGFGRLALKQFLYLCKKSFGMNSLTCQIDEQNYASVKLFEGVGFDKVGVLKQWRRVVGEERGNNELFQIVL